jgi:hypothetical protein
MKPFTELRQYIETHEAELRAAAEDPATFARELAALKRDWQSGDDPEQLAHQTERVLRKYPSVWAKIAPPTPAPVAPSAATPAPAAGEPQGATPMNEGKPSQSVLDRLAIWDKQLATAKEAVTGCLGLMIVFATLLAATIAMIAVFTVGDDKVWVAAKDILVLLIGLVGVVLGYYFGRLPGEARADKAEAEAKATRSSLDRTLTEVRTVLEDQGVDLTRGGPAGGVGLTNQQVERLRGLLRAER